MAVEFKGRENPDLDLFGRNNSLGGSNLSGKVVATGDCPFCDVRSSLTQIGTGKMSAIHGPMIAVECNSCSSVAALAVADQELHPPSDHELIDGLPEDIDRYYRDAFRSLKADAPNGAAATFRKVFNAVCIHYEVTDIEDDDSFYDMIEALADADHITEHLRKSLLVMKDAGADGAHINENDPTIETAWRIKELVDAVLNATVVAEMNVEKAREEHPNPYEN